MSSVDDAVQTVSSDDRRAKREATRRQVAAAVEVWRLVLSGRLPKARLSWVAKDHGIPPSVLHRAVDNAGMPTRCIPTLRSGEPPIRRSTEKPQTAALISSWRQVLSGEAPWCTLMSLAHRLSVASSTAYAAVAKAGLPRQCPNPDAGRPNTKMLAALEDLRRVVSGQAARCPMPEVAARNGVSVGALYRVAAKQGLSTRPRRLSDDAVAQIVKERREMLAGVRTVQPLRDIGARFGVSGEAIRTTLLRHGVEPMPEGHVARAALEDWRRVLRGETEPASLHAVAGRNGIHVSTLRHAVEVAGLPVVGPRRWDGLLDEWRDVIADPDSARCGTLADLARLHGAPTSSARNAVVAAGLPTVIRRRVEGAVHVPSGHGEPSAPCCAV